MTPRRAIPILLCIAAPQPSSAFILPSFSTKHQTPTCAQLYKSRNNFDEHNVYSLLSRRQIFELTSKGAASGCPAHRLQQQPPPPQISSAYNWGIPACGIYWKIGTNSRNRATTKPCPLLNPSKSSGPRAAGVVSATNPPWLYRNIWVTSPPRIRCSRQIR